MTGRVGRLLGRGSGPPAAAEVEVEDAMGEEPVEQAGDGSGGGGRTSLLHGAEPEGRTGSTEAGPAPAATEGPGGEVDASPAVDEPASAPEHEKAPAAPSLVRIGMVVWLASELMFFSGLFAAYYFLRGAEGEWPPEGVHLGTIRAGIFTAVLVASSGTIHLASHRSEHGDERGTRRWTILTIVLGAIFLLNQAAEYAELEFTHTEHAYGSLFYLMTGFHGAHVLGGLVLLGAMLVVATGRTSKAPLASTMSVGTYYWHFVDVVWVAMFATIYLVR